MLGSHRHPRRSLSHWSSPLRHLRGLPPACPTRYPLAARHPVTALGRFRWGLLRPAGLRLASVPVPGQLPAPPPSFEGFHGRRHLSRPWDPPRGWASRALTSATDREAGWGQGAGEVWRGCLAGLGTLLRRVALGSRIGGRSRARCIAESRSVAGSVVGAGSVRWPGRVGSRIRCPAGHPASRPGTACNWPPFRGGQLVLFSALATSSVF